MTGMAAAIPAPAADEAQALCEALRRGPSAGAIAALLGTPRVARVRRERVHFSGSRPAQMSLVVEKGDGALARIWAEWLGDGAAAHAEAERVSLRKSRRGQVAGAPHGGILADEAGGFVLRLEGLDSKLPGLRLLYDRAAVARLLSGIEGRDVAEAELRTTLVAHRLGKRAVLRVDGPGGVVRYVRLRATKSKSGREGFDRHVALWRALRETRALRVPEPLRFDDGLGAAVFAPLAGAAPVFAGLAGYRACRDIARAMEALRALAIEAPLHGVRDEMEILSGWAARLAVFAPDLEPPVSRGLDLLAQEMESLPEGPAVPCHRDLHEKQILLTQEGAGLLDFDTLRLGDPALDIGNLQAHLFLAGRRDRRPLATFEDALVASGDAGLAGRAAVWRRAALLRLGMIYAFTDEPRVTIDALIAEALTGRRA